MLKETYDVLQSIGLKDLITLLGVSATFLVGYKNLKNAKKHNEKSLYINSITKERIESLSKLKLNLAKYFSIMSLINSKSVKGNLDISDKYAELEQIKYEIFFQLNPENPDEEMICKEFNKINNIVKVLMIGEENVSENAIKDLLNEHNLDMYTFYKIHKKYSANLSKEYYQNDIINYFFDTIFDILDLSKSILIYKMRKHLKNEWSRSKND